MTTTPPPGDWPAKNTADHATFRANWTAKMPAQRQRSVPLERIQTRHMATAIRA